MVTNYIYFEKKKNSNLEFLYYFVLSINFGVVTNKQVYKNITHVKNIAYIHTNMCNNYENK